MKTKYKIFKTKASPFGGLYVISEFLSQIKFHPMFNRIFGNLRRIRRYKPSDSVSLLIALITGGGERLYDIDNFSNDPVVADLFDVNDIPQDTTLRDDLYLIGQKDQERQEFLFQLNEMLFEKFNIRSITIDIDGTALPVDGHQEGAVTGYCPEEKGSRCFQSLEAICVETETVLAERTDAGNTHCANGIVDFVKILLERFSDRLGRITIRMDTGFYSDELFKLIESYPNVNYLVGVPKHDWLLSKITSLDYKSYFGSERHYVFFSYGEGLDGQFRHYYVERTIKERGSQNELFEPNDYTYRVVVTRRQRQPQVVFNAYNDRGRIEKSIEELKNQYALGKMVSGKFIITKALAWISHLTFTLIGMVRTIAFRRQMARYRLRRLRFILFSAIGLFVEHSRKREFQIALSGVSPPQFNSIMNRIWSF